MKKRLKPQFGGGMREFQYEEAEYFVGVDRKRAFLSCQQRSAIVRNFLLAIRADERGRELSVADKCLFKLSERQVIGQCNADHQKSDRPQSAHGVTHRQ